MFKNIGNGVIGVALLFVVVGLVGCDDNPQQRDRQSEPSLSVEIGGSGLLTRGLMDDKRGFAYVPVTGSRIKESDDKAREQWMKSLWKDWSEQFPRKEIFVMSPLVENGEIWGVTITYSMR